MRKIELLVPASSLEVLKIAVIFGADAVYIGVVKPSVSAPKPRTFPMKIWQRGSLLPMSME